MSEFLEGTVDDSRASSPICYGIVRGWRAKSGDLA